MQTLPLNAWAYTNLDSSGNGTTATGPTSQGETWQVSAVSVHCASNATESTCRIYVGGDSSPGYFCDGTTWGSTGDSTSNIPPSVAVGTSVFAVWNAGDGGTEAYLTVTGTRRV